MKRIYIILFLLLCIGVMSAAAAGRDSLRIADIRLDWQGDSLQVGFNIDVNKRIVKRGHAFLITPVIAHAGNSLALKPILLERSEIEPFMPYRQTVPYSAWMQGGDLKLTAMSYDCCEVVDYPVGIVARGILTYQPEAAPTASTPASATPQTGQTPLMTVHWPDSAASTALPAGQAGANDALRDIPSYAVAVDNDDIPTTETEIRTAARGMRASSLNIQFRQGETLLDENYRDNRTVLNELVNVLRRLENSGDSRISYILIDGHVSPEGGSTINRPIGEQRAQAVKRYLEQRIALPPSRIVAHNGYIDWEYLKQLVRQSNMYEKQQVLDIIDQVPEWDSRRNIGRVGEIMRLYNGSTYRYMLREFFPKMRNATYIKVFYQDRR
jgi:outer membrane protein OmpA-like peptidoglycan-associated protein